MAVIQCPNCNFGRALDDGESGPFECPNCMEEDREWFANWFLLVSFLGVIIFDLLMDPDTLTKDESFWNFLIGFFDLNRSLGYWDFILVVILFLIFLTKLCPVCNRVFTWRKKWRLEWNNVINCSEKCRRDKSIEWSIGFSHKESK